jgi:DNA-binding transcriptional LysR family regulator
MLRLGAPIEIGRRLVAPLITEFRRKFPDVQVHLVLSDAGVDVIDDGLDVALRVGLQCDREKVLTAKRIVCASPAYFKTHGTPATPGDLLHHDCIRLVRGRRVVTFPLVYVIIPAFCKTLAATLTLDLRAPSI